MSPLTTAERAPIERCVARLVLRELDPAAAAQLGAPPLADLLAKLDPEVPASLNPWTADREEAAREEFARLFLLPGGVSPCASAWLPGEREALGARLATLITRALEALGRRRAQDDRLPLDHLALLLELVADASAAHDEATRAVGDIVRREALGPWVARFGAALRAQAKLPIYRAAGTLLELLHGN